MTVRADAVPATLCRMKLQVRCVLAVLAVVAAAGCGSTDSGQATASGEEATSPTRSTAPSTAEGPTHYEGVIEKKIGEPAGLNCYEDADSCDLNFSVTAIQQRASCSAGDDPLGPDEQFLRFDIDAFSTHDTFRDPDTETALRLQNWSVDGPAGPVSGLQSYPECGSKDAIVAAPITPGPHVRTRVVVRAPKAATTLRLSWYSLMWEWPIPGAD